MKTLENKVALVTGGTNGIGAVTVKRLTAEGAKVVFTGSNQQAAEQVRAETGARFFAHQVQDDAGWKELMAMIDKEFGRLDICFANAGTNSGDSDIETITLEGWNNVLAVNLTGAMLSCQYALKAMKNNPGGSSGSIIVNSSINGMMALAGDVAYSTTKGALRLLTKSTAVYCAKSKLNIRCNAILPGVVETPLIQGAIAQAPDSAAARNMLENIAPMGRMGRCEEIAGMVVYLASDDAAFVTGAEFVIDGGSTAGLSGV